MSNDYVVDVFTDQPRKWMSDYPFRRVSGKYGVYYSVCTTNAGRVAVSKMAHKSGIKYRYYEKKWSRSDSYRSKFFKHNKAPYRCRYCHRPLKKEYLVVDHLVPVAKTKKSTFARSLLHAGGIDNVNDWRNLVPSCHHCNSRKSDKMGLWYIRGILGRHKLYWCLLRLTEATGLITVMTLIVLYLLKM